VTTAPSAGAAPIAAPRTSAASTPEAVARERLAARRAAADALAARDRTLSRARLAVFLAGVGAAIAVFAAGVLAPGWLLLPLAAFVALVVRHDRVIAARTRAERAAAYWARSLARMDGSWLAPGEAAGSPARPGPRDGAPAAPSAETGERFLARDHLYAADLDLFGRGSLFERVCSARTRAGEETLAAWLAQPAPAEEVRARQAAVAELKERLDLREELVLVGEDVRAGLAPDALVAWAVAPESDTRVLSPARRGIAALLAAATLLALAAWLGAGAVALPFLGAALASLLFAALHRRAVQPVIHGVERPLRDLRLLAQILERIEAERFESERLRALRAALEQDGVPPSRRVARLRLLADLLDARRNQLFAPLGALVLWSTQLAFAIAAWRRASGAAVPRWIAAVGEIEALCSLAGLAWEQPGWVFPSLAADGPCFDATALGHPLLPAGRCVRNDLRLGPDLRLLVVSGSNMSGKSTLLRSVGVNAVLALAGAPVCAAALRLAPLSLGASIRVQDSLQEGASRFYAEITRLGALVRRAEAEPPLLFLLDEILAGTNSHDRRIGAEAVIRGLLARGGFGLVTTHDLALARIADDLAPGAANVHFEDQVVEGRMEFDFRLRTGVVRKSNALALMRAVGLDVGEAGGAAPQPGGEKPPG